MLFDTHAHYDDDQFDGDRETLLASLPERGVGLVVNPGCTVASSRTAVELAPTFVEYGAGLAQVGCRVERYFLHQAQNFDLDERFLSFLEGKKPEVVFLCNPNNPTGRLIPLPLLEQILQYCAAQGARLFLDECFLDLTEDGVSAKSLLAAHPELPALLDAGLDSVNISLDTLRPEVFQRITARDEFSHVIEGLRAALDSGIPVKLNCVPQAGVNEGELEDLAALAEAHPLQVRFIEMMPIGYGAAMPCISGPALRERFARRWPEFAPLPAAQSAVLGDGPAVYYTVPGWEGDVGFIAAVHGKFCASCNRVRLTSQGFLRPCLASEAGCDLRELLRSGAPDAALSQAIRQTIWAKPREHHFGDNSMPATRGMYRIGG